MATQEELEFQALLNQAMAGAGQAPSDMPVQAVDPVRAERLAFEASQAAPVASIAPPVASIAPPASVAPNNDPQPSSNDSESKRIKGKLVSSTSSSFKDNRGSWKET